MSGLSIHLASCSFSPRVSTLMNRGAPKGMPGLANAGGAAMFPGMKHWIIGTGLMPLAGGMALGAEALPLATSFWRDPAFVKSFNGSYRIEARIEPTVSSEERGLLVEIQKLMADGRREAALEKVRDSELLSGSAPLRFNLGNLLFEEGELEEAREAFEEAIDEYPSFRRAHRNLGLALVRLGDLDAALEHLLEAMRLGDSDGTTYGLVGYCRLQRGEWASALHAYRMAQVSQPESTQWKAGIAQCLQHLDAKAEAVALLDEIIREIPEESSYAVLQASLLIELGRPTEAIEALELPQRLGRLDADGLILLAGLNLGSGRVEAAGLRVAEAFEAESPPSEGRVLEVIARAVRVGEWKLAGRLVERATAAADAPSRALRLAAARLAIESGEDPESGAAMLRELIVENPTDGEALLALGRYEVGENRPDEGELLLERATAAPETAAEAWIELTRVRVAAERYTDALEAVDEARALRPSEALAAYRDALARLVEAAE